FSLHYFLDKFLLILSLSRYFYQINYFLFHVFATLFILIILPPLAPTLFPYTTLFRSCTIPPKPVRSSSHCCWVWSSTRSCTPDSRRSWPRCSRPGCATPVSRPATR